ncbi:AAA family ATPase [Streptomyces tsukubensis]|uniref:Septum formation initiator n=1 Tax=Streptomyces tsukubensis TaxID=83656 RepID=A0A1V4ACY0_9ACTN|nr:AAA family ATPase [Streptomyces tsukubensis]OON81382.1 septum formation initiator [Streptomyces tsukubensis]QFR95492.1 AAA family ATPase [Streptomyces tsukubensis]
MTIRILPAVGDIDVARSLTSLLGQLPEAEPALPVADATALLDTLARLAGESLDELPEVVLVHERVGPVPAFDLIRDVVRRFPAVGVVLITADTGTAVLTGAMDAGARGIIGLPLAYDALAERVQAAAAWSAGMRRHLGNSGDVLAGPGGRVVTVTGAKGGVGTTLAAVQLALAAQASGRAVALLDLDLQAGDVASYLDVQFRRSVVDLAGINDITPRVLQDAVFTHPTGVGLLLAPAEGERGEEVTDRVARQVVSALRTRYDTVVIDCGTQLTAAGAAAVETADVALLLVTPDVMAVRAAKRTVRLWERLQIRKAEETVTVLNRHTRATEIQPALVERITGTRTASTTVPAQYKELQAAVDAGRVQDLDDKGTVKQALWALAGELGLVKASERPEGRRRRLAGDRGPSGGGRRRRGDDRGAVTLEFAGMFPLLLVVMTILWQCALYGYTYSLVGNAADEGARAGTAAAASGAGGAAACEAAARKHLPGAWDASAVSCTDGEVVYKARVEAKVPLFFPGFDAGWHATGEAGAATEGDG